MLYSERLLTFSRNCTSPTLPQMMFFIAANFLFTLSIFMNSGATMSLYYAYDETTGKRGSDDVASMLHHFIRTYCPDEVKHLELFCDSCGGQNRNFTVFRFLYAHVHLWNRFEIVRVSFSVRGHSYMECDRDFASFNNNKKKTWYAEFRSARAKPTPYTVVEMSQKDFLNFSDLLKPRFKTMCPVASRPIRDLLFKKSDPLLMFF